MQLDAELARLVIWIVIEHERQTGSVITVPQLLEKLRHPGA